MAKKAPRKSGKPQKPAAKPARTAARKKASKPAPKAKKPAGKRPPVKKAAKKAPRRRGPAGADAVVEDEGPVEILEEMNVPSDATEDELQAIAGEPAPPPVAPGARLDGRAFAIEAARLLEDDKCSDVVVLDVSKLTSVSDFIVIGTGTSDRQMRSVLDDVAELGAASGHQVARKSVDDRATWVLADFVDVVVHLFEPNTRAYYDLEMMWGDAPRLGWQRPAGHGPRPRNRRIIAE